MKTKYLILALLTLSFFFLGGADLIAQCPMCKIAAESNLENGGSAGKGLNTGILYMLSMPYVIIATLAFIWYRNRKSSDEISEESLIVE